ncbi:MAG: thioredoxin family protein [Rhodothermales bacterium]
MMKITIALAALFAFGVFPGLAQERPSIVVAAEGVDWLPLSKALETAAAENKKVLIDVYAPWCGFCRRMHAETYSDPVVQEYLNDHFISTRVDADSSEEVYSLHDNELNGSEMGQYLGVRGFPTTVFLFSDSRYITPLPGFVESNNFLQVLKFIATDAFETQSFDDFRQEEGR